MRLGAQYGPSSTDDPTRLSGESKTPRRWPSAIVNSIHEPFIVLDAELRVLVRLKPVLLRDLPGRSGAHPMAACSYDLRDGQWDIPALRLLLLAENDHSRAHGHGRLRGRPRLSGRRPPDHAA
jgi:hypothetical protein